MIFNFEKKNLASEKIVILYFNLRVQNIQVHKDYTFPCLCYTRKPFQTSRAYIHRRRTRIFHCSFLSIIPYYVDHRRNCHTRSIVPKPSKK